MNRWLSLFLLTLLLVSCDGHLLTPSLDAVEASKETPVITPTLKSTPSPIVALSPTVELPLEQQPLTKQATTELARALTNAGMPTTSEQILQQGFVTREVVGADGESYEISSTQDGYPLMIKTKGGQWEVATMGKLGNMNNITFSFQGGYSDKQKQAEVLRQMATNKTEIQVGGVLQMNHIFRNFIDSDWQSVITNWDAIQAEFSKGNIPQGYSFFWSDTQDLINVYEEMVGKPEFRAQALLWNLGEGDIRSMIDRLNLNQDNVRIILEFTVKSRVLQYKDKIHAWDVSDEFMSVYVANRPEKNFWPSHTGWTPAELMTEIAGWVKTTNPNAKTYVVDAGMFNYNQVWTAPIRQANIKLLKELSAMHAPIDGYIDENNLSINTGFDVTKAQNDLDLLRSLGFELGGSETMVAVGPIDLNGWNGKLGNETGSDEVQQAKVYYKLLNFFLDNKVAVFGFGSIDDESAWTVSDMPDANPLLFDKSYHAKLAYYYVMKALSERLINK